MPKYNDYDRNEEKDPIWEIDDYHSRREECFKERDDRKTEIENNYYECVVGYDQ